MDSGTVRIDSVTHDDQDTHWRITVREPFTYKYRTLFTKSQWAAARCDVAQKQGEALTLTWDGWRLVKIEETRKSA